MPEKTPKAKKAKNAKKAAAKAKPMVSDNTPKAEKPNPKKK